MVARKYKRLRYEDRQVKLVMDYLHINIFELQELPIDIYLFFMREAYIESLSTTDEGKEYLNNCWRLEQTKPDRENIRRNFEKRG